MCVVHFFAGIAFGQGGNARTVTLVTGLRYEGEIFPTQKVAAAAFEHDPALGELVLAIDDGLRRVFVSNREDVIVNVGPSNQGSEIEFNIFQKIYKGNDGNGGFIKASPFDQFGHRNLLVSVKSGKRTIQKTYVQGITKITPRYVEVASLVGDKNSARNFAMRLSLRSVPSEIIKRLMLNQIKDKNDPTEFYEIAQFFQQAKDYTEAERLLRRVERDFPGQRERIQDARDELRQFEANQVLGEVKNRITVGQPKLGISLAKSYLNVAKSGLAGEILAEFQDIQDQRDEELKQLDETREKIFELIKRIRNLDPGADAAVKFFAQEIESELNLYNVRRLDAFLSVADAAAQPDHDKMARAISGWLLGTNLANNNLAVVQGFFEMRELVKEYLLEDTKKLRRSEILNRLQRIEGATPANLEAMVRQMKTIEPENEAIKNYDGSKPIEFKISLNGPPADPVVREYSCLVHLPTEYSPYKKYPIVLTLPDGMQPLETNLNMWCGSYDKNLGVRLGQANRNGYIVCAVDYRLPGGQTSWGYSTREHYIVYQAIRQCLRRFSIDGDRVFLSGHGVGGEGAYDFGAAHPEHFAGVLGYSGTFSKYTNIYKDNRHINLPFYCVNGSKHVNAIVGMEDAVNRWIRSRKFNDVTVVHYKGRMNEYFEEDIPEAFKWMRAQIRPWPDRNGFEFQVASLRPNDNYYWFFEMKSLPDDRMSHPELFKRNPLKKMTISGKVQNNVFRLEPMSYLEHDSTVWLSPAFVDMSKMIYIKNRSEFKGTVNGSIETMLNDLLRRADREHPFWAKIDLVNRRWEKAK